ncbi:MAG: glycerol dehydrogenase [Burkholderiaceae bacterium]
MPNRKGQPPRIFAAPLRYLQGPGVLDSVGSEVARIGSSAVLVAGPMAHRLIDARVQRSCEAAGVSLRLLTFGGEITRPEIDRMCASLAQDPPAVVLAAGGGKSIDAGKGVARTLACEVITIPTVASNDAPTSKILVVYDHHHRIVDVEHMTHNPAAVLVDTALIAQAPRQLLLAGIGDALSKKFEVACCHGAGGHNIHGGMGTLTALALADLSYRLLREHSVAALRALDTGQPDDALEAVVEASVLLSGLCFENGGLSIAHAMTRGLTAVRGAVDQLHGLQVAYGLMVQLVLEERPIDFLVELAGFYRQIGLPVSLGALGMTNPPPTPQEMGKIAELTLSSPMSRNFARALTVEQVVAAMHTVESVAAG